MFLEPSSRDDVDEALDDALTSSLTPESPSTIRSSADRAFMSSGSRPQPNRRCRCSRPRRHDDDEPLIKLPVCASGAARGEEDTRYAPTARGTAAIGRRDHRRLRCCSFSTRIVERSAPPDDNSTQPIERLRPGVVTAQPSRPGARLIAVAHRSPHPVRHRRRRGYFTLRMAGLSMAEWSVLPVAPMATFLGLLKVAYFYAFTAVGGQTIGKMAVGHLRGRRQRRARRRGAARCGGHLPASCRSCSSVSVLSRRCSAIIERFTIGSPGRASSVSGRSDSASPGMFLRRLGVFIATCAHVGYAPVAPGTFGSAVGLAVYYLVRRQASTAVELGRDCA